MLNVTGVHQAGGSFFLQVPVDQEQQVESINVGADVVGCRWTTDNTLVLPLSDLETISLEYNQPVPLRLGDEELVYSRMLQFNRASQYFQICENRYLFFDEMASLGLIEITEADLRKQVFPQASIQSSTVEVTDDEVIVELTKQQLSRINNVYLVDNGFRREAQFEVHQDTLNVSLYTLQAIGSFQVKIEMKDDDGTFNTYSVKSDSLQNSSQQWMAEVGKALTLTTNALAINFDERDVGVIGYAIDEKHLTLTLVSDEVAFEKLYAISAKTSDEYELKFSQTDDQLTISLADLPTGKDDKYYIQGEFFEIYFRLYMPQSKGNRIQIPHTLHDFYFSTNGRLTLSNYQREEVTADDEQGQVAYEQHALGNHTVLLTSSNTINNRIVFDNETYQYASNRYVDRKLETRNVVEVISQYPGRYQLCFNCDIDVQALHLVHKKIKSELDLPFNKQTARIYNLQLEDIFGLFGDERAEFELSVLAKNDEGHLDEFLIADSEMKGAPDWKRYFDAEVVPKTPKNNIATRVYYDKRGRVSLLNRASLPTDQYARNLPITPKIEDIQRHGDKLDIVASYSLEEIEKFHDFVKFSGAFLYKTIDQQERIDVDLTQDSFHNQLVLTVDLQKLTSHDRLGHYVIVLQAGCTARTFEVKLIEPSEKYTEKLANSRYVFATKVGQKKRVVLPKLGGPKDFTLFVDDFKPLDSWQSIAMENRAVRRFVSGKVQIVPDKYILFEKEANYAQDNGFALFEWIQKNVPNNNTYYVINKNSPHLDKLKSYQDHILFPGTRKYFLNLLTSNVVVGSENPIHLYDGDRAYISPFMQKVMFKKKVIFLQHGVTALKNISKFKNFRADANIIDYFVSTNQEERIIIHQNLGYDYDKIPVLGFTRWDKFHFDENKQKDTILYVPTNRQWLVKATDEEFINSDYYHGIMSLITNPQLVNLLNAKHLKFQVFVHPLMQKFTSTISSLSPAIEILSIADNDLGVLLRQADLLITDYSSVAWDFAVQRKPVLFYQFDRDVYEKRIGSFMDLKTIPIGNSHKHVKGIVEDIQDSVANDFKMADATIASVNAMFGEYHDDVCEKTFSFIQDIS